MDQTLVGIIGCVILILMFFLNMPVAFVMALVGLAGIWYLQSATISFDVLSREFFSTFSTYTLSCIPGFVLMGTIAANSGISKNLYAAGYAFVGHFRGGLALATTIGCALFAAVSGSSAAEAATMAKIALPEMKKYNYDTSLATGSIAAAGTLAILIPPSMGLIIYGFLTQESIGKLFIAGIIPGILLTVLFMAVVYIICLINPSAGPAGRPVTWKTRIASLSGCIDMILLFLLIIIGLFVGLFTPTEGGAIGAVGALIISLVRRQMNWHKFLDSLKDTAVITSMFFAILAGAFVFGRFMAYSGITFALTNWLTTGPFSPYVVMWLIFFMYAIAGCFMDFSSIGALTIPILFPIIINLGFDPLWFGIITVVSSEMALITPPVGMNVFIIKSVAPSIPINTIFKGATPFLAAEFCLFLILLHFPQIATFLPSLMTGN